MTCSLFLTIGKVTPEVFFEACLLGTKKRISHGDQADVMTPSQPLTALVMIQTEFPFQFAVVLFDPPAGLGDAHQAPQPQRLRTELGQPIFRRLLLTLRPFDQQPLDHPRRVRPPPPSMRRPYGEPGKTGALWTSAALTPRHRTPRRGGQLLNHLLQALRPRPRLQRRMFSRPPRLFLS